MSVLSYALGVFALISMPLFGQTAPVNLDFESGPLGQVPSGWTVWHSEGVSFQPRVVSGDCRQGLRCALLPGAGPSLSAYGQMSQTLPLHLYLGRHVRLRAAVRTDGAANTFARLRIRLGSREGQVHWLTSDNIRSTEWTYFHLDAPVPLLSTSVLIAVEVHGPGQVWVDDVSAAAITPDWIEPPRELSETGLQNVIAFARLLGYVRHFHPSDQAARTDWNRFAVDGVHAIEDAAGPHDLAEKLQALFDPVAPTIRVWAGPNRPASPAELTPSSGEGLRAIRWAHVGVELVSSRFFTSERRFVSASGGSLPAEFVPPTEPYVAELGRGVSAFVPLTLYADAQGTLPHRPEPASKESALTAEDRATRIASVILGWNVLQHFYPYFDVIDSDWQEALVEALKTAAAEPGEVFWWNTMTKLVAALRDGHGLVFPPPGHPRSNMVPLVWDWVEHQLVVTRVKGNSQHGVTQGDRVVRIDGRSVEELLVQRQRHVSGATPQHRLLLALSGMAHCDAETSRMRLDIEPSAEPGSIRSVELPCGADFDWSDRQGETIRELEPGIMYVDIDRLTDAMWYAALPALQNAKGIIFDLRGYPRTHTYLSHLTESLLRWVDLYAPTPAKPDQVDMKFQYATTGLLPVAPYLHAKRVFLTDGRAVSYAETVMSIVEHHRLAEIVGGATAGTNGEVIEFNLPGYMRVRFTGRRVLKQDGSQHHGVGIRPTIPARRTRKGIAEGKDEVLLRGIEVLKGPAEGPAPEISAEGIVNAASHAGGPVAPGEIVTIYGRFLGPSQLEHGYYDGSGYLANYADGTRVFFDDIQAPIVHATETQVSAIVPYSVQASTKVRVEYQLRSSNVVSMSVADAAPGIFMHGGETRAVVVNQNGSLNSGANPAAPGEIVTLFATGAGRTFPSGVTGRLPWAGRWPAPDADVQVIFGDIAGEVQFQGVVSAGVLQINVKVPPAAPSGAAVPLVLRVGTANSQAATLSLQ